MAEIEMGSHELPMGGLNIMIHPPVPGNDVEDYSSDGHDPHGLVPGVDQSVPTPGALSLLLLGALGAAGSRRRRR